MLDFKQLSVSNAWSIGEIQKGLKHQQEESFKIDAVVVEFAIVFANEQNRPSKQDKKPLPTTVTLVPPAAPTVWGDAEDQLKSNWNGVDSNGSQRRLPQVVLFCPSR